MMRFRLWLIGIAMFPILVCAVNIGILPDERTRAMQTDADDKTFRSPFRYVIASNEIDDRFNEKSRGIDVVMDRKAFSEQNLKLLYQLLAKRFPIPYDMTVFCYTDLEDIPTPEERDGPISTPPEGPGLRTTTRVSAKMAGHPHPLAVFLRNEANECIRYKYFPTPKSMPGEWVLRPYIPEQKK
jgi:hypothetical protein